MQKSKDIIVKIKLDLRGIYFLAKTPTLIQILIMIQKAHGKLTPLQHIIIMRLIIQLQNPMEW